MQLCHSKLLTCRCGECENPVLAVSQIVCVANYARLRIVVETVVCILLPVAGMDIVSEVTRGIHCYRPLAVTIHDTPLGTDVNR